MTKINNRNIGSLQIAATALLACLLAAPSVLGNCECHSERGATTRPGANQFVLEVTKQPYRNLEGTVEMHDGRPIENALVEVFDNPDYLLAENPLQGHPEQKRFAACRTASNGKFCLRGLPSGKYELRSSIDAGWNTTHIYVVVDRKTGLSNKIQVRMSVGT